MTNEPEGKPERYTIQSTDKALDLIELLADRGTLSLTELAELLGQPKSSTYRIILTLENRGFISRSDEDGKYCLGYKQLMMTKNMLERNSLRSAALPSMKQLSETFGDTVNLGVLVDGKILYVDIIEGTYPLRMLDTVGSRSPFHATAIGKAIAAFLPEDTVRELIQKHELSKITSYTVHTPEQLFAALEQVRRLGYAVDDQEIVEGARCVAAPVFNMHGKIEGAISLSGALHRFSDDRLLQIAEQVTAAASSASRKLGYM